MIENMLDSPRIKVELNTDFKDIGAQEHCEKLIYTGQIDEFCDFRFGRLPYRSLEFVLKTYGRPYFQETAQVNYPNHFEFTRITEYKHFLDQDTERTTVAYEYPRRYDAASNEPYYPMTDRSSRALFREYWESCRRRNDVCLVGRLAQYKYYNMDEVVAAALQLAENELGLPSPACTVRRQARRPAA